MSGKSDGDDEKKGLSGKKKKISARLERLLVTRIHAAEAIEQASRQFGTEENLDKLGVDGADKNQMKVILKALEEAGKSAALAGKAAFKNIFPKKVLPPLPPAQDGVFSIGQG